MRPLSHLALATLLLVALPAAVPAGEPGTAKDRGAHRQAILDRFDTNHDGKLDQGERAAMRQALSDQFKAKHPKAFAEADTNHDGVLSRAEFKAWRQAHPRTGHHGTKGSDSPATATPAPEAPATGHK